MFSTESVIVMPVLLIIIAVFLLLFVYSYEEILFQNQMDAYAMNEVIEDFTLRKSKVLKPKAILIKEGKVNVNLYSNFLTGKKTIEGVHEEANVFYKSTLYDTQYNTLAFVKIKVQDKLDENEW